MNKLVHLVLSASFSVVAAAQSCTYTYGTNAQVPPATSGSGPLMTSPSYQRIQFVVLASNFMNAPTVIRDLSCILEFGLVHWQFSDLKIRMGYTANMTLDTTFAQNYAAPLTEVMHARDYDVYLTTNWSDFGMQTPFYYIPGLGHLLIEIECVNGTILPPYVNHAWAQDGIVWGVRGGSGVAIPTTGTTWRMPRLRLCTDRADLSVHGQPCGSAATAPLLGLSGNSSLGNQTTFWVSNAPANSLSFLAFGFDNAPPYPIDMASLGASGCLQYIPFTVVSPVVTDSFGVGRHALTIPNQLGLIGVIVMGQYVVLAPSANTLGALTSNYGRVLVGL